MQGGAGENQLGHRSLFPAYLGWGIGATLIALGPPLAWSFGPLAFITGLLVILWVTLRAGKHRISGPLTAIAGGLIVGFVFMSVLWR